MKLDSLDKPDQVIKVLLIEDDEDDYIITRDLFSEIKAIQFDLEWIKTYEEALEAIKQQAHDVILVDYQLGAHTGLEILQAAAVLSCQVPIIFLTGQGGPEVDIAASEIGAADYLIKGQVDSRELERTIRYTLKTYQKINRMQFTLEKLQLRYQKTYELQRELGKLQLKLSEADLDLKPSEEIVQYLKNITDTWLSVNKGSDH